MKKFIVFIITFYLALLLFMPKLYLWYGVEKVLNTHNIQIESKIKETKLSSLSLQNGTIFFKGKKIVSLKEIDFLPLIFFNKITLNNLRYHNRYPIFSQKTVLTHSLIHPITIKITSNGNFGDIEGNINMKKREIVLTIKPTEKFENSKLFKKLFHKSDKGYLHESTF